MPADASQPETPRGAPMDEDDIVAAVMLQMQSSIGYSDSKLSEARRRNLAYYLGEATGDLSPSEVPDTSSYVSTDVHDTVEWMLPSLVKTFVAGDQVVEYEPRTPADEEGAAAATQFANFVLHTQNRGFMVVYTMVKDALLSRAGILKVWFEEAAEDRRETYHGLQQQQVVTLLNDPQVTPISVTQHADPDGAGLPAVCDIVVKRTQPRRRIRIDNVPPEEFLVDRAATTTENARFLAHRYRASVSDLRALGYDVTDLVSADNDDGPLTTEAIERRAWDDDLGAQQTDDSTTAADDTQRLVWVTDAVMRLDADGDGIAELRRIVIAGRKVRKNEEADGNPFCVALTVPLPHRFFGLCPADQAVPTQRVKTSIVRAALDGLYHSVNGRTYALENQVNLDDLLTNRPGGVVRIKTPGAVGALQEGRPDLGAAMTMLEREEQARENRTGFTRYSQGTSADALNQTATGVNSITSRGDARVELIARVLAETGFRDLFARILQLATMHFREAVVGRVNGKWAQWDPRTWSTGYGFVANCGTGTNNKDLLIAHLMQLGKLQGDAKAAGIPVQPRHIYATLKRVTEALGFRQVDQFFPDPGDQSAAPHPDPKLIEVQGKLEIERVKVMGELQLQRERLEAEIALKRELAAMQIGLPAESAIYGPLYTQSEAMVDGPNDGRQPPANQGGGPGPAGIPGARQPAVLGAVQGPAIGVPAGLGIQPGA